MSEHMNWRGKVLALVILVIAAGLLVFGIRLYDREEKLDPAVTQVIAENERPTASRPESLADKYADLGLIDVHNHDAYKYLLSFPTWNRYHVGKIVLFGNISEPSAMITDALAWGAYNQYPDRIYPFFSGFNMFEEEGLQTVRNQLEKGFLGVGETVAASSNSPVLANVIWKASDSMDGNLPKVYELCAEYDAPILLHIDPPSGMQIEKLEEALKQYPDTLFIFAHANVYQDADSIGKLLESYSNLYIDFFAGFTSYNPASPYKTESYIDLIEQYPDRFFLSTDGAYDMTYDEAIPAMYETIELLKPETRKKVASGNFQRIIDAQRPTKTQLKLFEKLGGSVGTGADPATLSRHEMNKLLFKLDAASKNSVDK
ncbi:amidohydrolase family protein [Cohnella mopanensis]|uniref:amidohydrolase family protein n=1 Tax=Cohnella mopanensis TaxID=2911966 RepID=UPI001EF94DB4|nr:amidohydrolase family protein [Cohnella mopanensis]